MNYYPLSTANHLRTIENDTEHRSTQIGKNKHILPTGMHSIVNWKQNSVKMNKCNTMLHTKCSLKQNQHAKRVSKLKSIPFPLCTVVFTRYPQLLRSPTNILLKIAHTNRCIHLILLGLDAFLLVFNALYFRGIHDTWAARGGDVRNITNLTLSPSIIFGYLLKSPFGGKGWIVSVDDLEYIIRGHVWLGFICILGRI